MGSAKRSHRNTRAAPQLRSRTTRSSRARLLTTDETATNTHLLTDQLRSLGLYAAPTLGDGNCLFRALSDQLYGSPAKHAFLRRDICDWIERHKERYEPFVEDERGLDVHLRCMRENATYGGHMELSAFAHMTRRNVKVVQPGLVYVIEWAAFEDSPAPPQHQDEEEGGEVLSGKERRKLRKERMRAEKLERGEQEEEGEEEEGGTVYVAYHDWEHFSSIRNLRGPHTGLPNVHESPAPDVDDPPPPEKPKSSNKPTSRAKPPSSTSTQNKVPKVKLKLSAPPTPSTTPAPESSRGVSPASISVSVPSSSSGFSSLSSLTSSCSSSLSSSPEDDLPPGSPMKLAPEPRREGGSPKRSFDDDGEGEEGRGGKRSRSGSCSPPPPSHTKEMEISSEAGSEYSTAEDEETPALSSPGSSSTSPSPPPAQRRMHPYAKGGSAMTMTKRQRKALGLPKHGKVGSAGKIVIPGGRFRKGEVVGEPEAEGEEWRKNGTGRVDVRGFRELKI